MRDFSTLPVLDLAPMRGGEAGRRAFAEALARAAREVGFFYLSGHGIPAPVFDTLLAETKRFFALPIDEKMRVYIGLSDNHRGYVPEGEEVFAGGSKDRKEAFDLSIEVPADDPECAVNPLIGSNLWPALPGFREAAMAYYDQAFAVGRLLMQGFAMALGQRAEFFDAYVTRPPNQLRLIHYPYDSGAVDAPGIGAHTDYECFTLLRATSPGLEVLNDRGEWIDAPPIGDAFIVNVGDMMEILSNGGFVATSHRVRKVGQERYSFPLFFTFNYDTRVAPLEACVAPGAERRTGLIAGEHLFAQTAQTFRYQKDRLARGEVVLPPAALGLSSFGHTAAS